MRGVVLILAVGAALAGCSVKVDSTKDADGNSAAGDNVAMRADNGQLALDVPGFSAKLDIPGLHFSPEHMDLDGLKLFPGTKTRGMRVDAQDGPGKDDDGTVRLDFSAAAPPEAVLGYYRDAAPRAGYAIDATPAAGSAFSAFSATKPRDDGDGTTHVAIALHPEGNGSAGTMTITGGKSG